MKVRIVDDGLPGGTTRITHVPPQPGAPEDDLSAKCYRYEVTRNVGEFAKATLFVYAETETLADGTIVGVPRTLIDRARDMAARLGNPAVTAAFGELLGVSMKAERPEA
jgi:hypothetical protein